MLVVVVAGSGERGAGLFSLHNPDVMKEIESVPSLGRSNGLHESLVSFSYTSLAIRIPTSYSHRDVSGDYLRIYPGAVSMSRICVIQLRHGGEKKMAGVDA